MAIEYDSARHNFVLFGTDRGFVKYSESGIHTKLEGLIQMCLNKTYVNARTGNHLSDTFPAQNDMKVGDALTPLLFKFIWNTCIQIAAHLFVFYRPWPYL
jgi:hypothetical protein